MTGVSYTVDPIRLAILTISDGVAHGARTDGSGDAIAAWAAERGHPVAHRAVVPDESARIAAALVDWADSGAVDLVLTTGGTGLTSRDITPEATRAVLQRDAPGLAEAIRAAGAAATPYAALSRGLAGVRARTLVVNLPGGTGGVRDGLAVLDRVLPHAVQLLRGTDTERHEQPNA
ncbi:MAG TPA: MogA/MoaB family molybdenum cofactor biosynthesis protein [Longimicrobiales bacterium]|nr:MogA/MoaB family molybdenum cofactor biosynthesis protein [Longimicrobiales bacterium]